MTDQHRATPKQWATVERCSETVSIPWSTASCLLELRARVEALERFREAMQRPRVFTARELTQQLAPVPRATADSLVERVQRAIGNAADGEAWEPEARAAIREVAAWLDERDTSIQNELDCLEAPFADDAIRWLREEAGL